MKSHDSTPDPGRLEAYDYDLPRERIAQHPSPVRHESRMMEVRRDRDEFRHRRVSDLPDLLEAGDLLVFNDTRVIPARIFGHKKTGGQVELLLLEEQPSGEWEALLKCSRRPAAGEDVECCGGELRAAVLEHGERGRVRLRLRHRRPLMEILEEYGLPPLPPYIDRSDASSEQVRQDRARYQTVYAAEPGAVAAPTAGLHFSPELLDRLEARGVQRAMVTLHVGLGTFRPVTESRIERHRMDEERYRIPAQTRAMIAAARNAQRRVIAVGSTVVRTLESEADRLDPGPEGSAGGDLEGRSGLFIYPPYPFRSIDAILTNFHLPRSTLLMMMAAFAGRERILSAYREAVREQYRFYSYGDCMLIL
ncbi:tRNA preQ1(34) S-adenosylmethionine ribosyltransferase-isomerase QueA [Kiritimatiella glycovorans]|uniref:S-adenosylmethionine:tRNA ribosyltransferase-isomerase n=1 Tax=Kiritimatiella glycovorans TaxID=1307763 RepID=A0A0G3EG15_9BACT|nr:tRNA preQ1(34) S-adenosylmethionine ribosyltransferase-isomerase QueA [Kiritimatiella glycovorans]AKJ64317.1 S-adenosylmethionine:tRNA ribosyltransferase-isomerase [Kiritimatiella glycovorans]